MQSIAKCHESVITMQVGLKWFFVCYRFKGCVWTENQFLRIKKANWVKSSRQKPYPKAIEWMNAKVSSVNNALKIHKVIVLHPNVINTWKTIFLCSILFTQSNDNETIHNKTPKKKNYSINQEQSHKSYRPLCVLTFRWNYAISGLEPMTYHLVNMLLHAVVSVMYYR